jgi:hypothetical protein
LLYYIFDHLKNNRFWSGLHGLSIFTDYVGCRGYSDNVCVTCYKSPTTLEEKNLINLCRASKSYQFDKNIAQLLSDYHDSFQD